MNRNIFHLLNQVETDMEQYHKEELNEVEANRWKKKVKKSVHVKYRKRNGKGLVAACIVALVVSLVSIRSREQVSAGVR